MSGAINHEAHEVYKRVKIMVLKWRQENRGRMPKYLLVSNDAYYALANCGMFEFIYDGQTKSFMGIEIAPVGVPGIYAAIGEEF